MFNRSKLPPEQEQVFIELKYRYPMGLLDMCQASLSWRPRLGDAREHNQARSLIWNPESKREREREGRMGKLIMSSHSIYSATASLELPQPWLSGLQQSRMHLFVCHPPQYFFLICHNLLVRNIIQSIKAASNP